MINKKSLKNVLIFGDSYSTYEGWVPSGYDVYYRDYYDLGLPYSMGGVEKTWWHKLIKDTKSKLIANDSYSGSSICNTGYNKDFEKYSFVARLASLLADKSDCERIDTVIIFGGTNDSWSNSPIGELQFENYSEEDLKSFAPAFCYVISSLKNKFSKAKIICVINTELKEEITSAMIRACRHYGVQKIELKDIDKLTGHPTVLGMEQIAKQIYDEL